MLALALLISRQLENSIIFKLSLLVPQELEIKNGLNGLIALHHQPEFTSEEIQLHSSLDASLLSATTDKLEAQSFAIPESKNADAKINQFKMSFKWIVLFPS